jgi:soluble lytic murein transglycosylase-like protein
MVRLLVAISLLALPAAARPPLHTWTDKDGVLHVEDAPPSRRARTAPRKTAPPEAAEAVRAAPKREQGWWEKRSDAPPDEIDRAAALHNIPAELVRAVIWAESAGDAGAISTAGAIGLMQLMPRTAGQMYVEDPVDPAQNIMGGTRYLRWLANQFNGDMLLTLAAYNAGPDAVRKYGGVPPFEETRQYVKRVLAYYQQLKAQKKKLVAEAAK